ncbi:MAG: hypothetical protein H6816_14290 [Phycisphaerales bacterium]|nr:hypothetical protein [Phycisphaerales bacterium]
MTDPATGLQDEINKRLTLNLLIQGSAQHAFLTSHHLIRDELNALDPDLLLLYDQLALAGFVQYWRGEAVLFFGRSDRFWKRVERGRHPFSENPLLARHGRALARAAHARGRARCREKRVSRIPFVFSLQFLSRVFRTLAKEERHKPALVELARHTTNFVWGISPDRLDASLTRAVRFGNPRMPTTFRGRMLQNSAVGYGGVLCVDGALRVVAKAWLWPILSHELVKGTAELICLHGLNRLGDAMYRVVTEAADRIEYEPWMLPVGAEFWRRLLPLFPRDRTIAESLMHLARLPARSLQTVMLAVMEDPDWAQELLAAAP